jgi:large subunit ribosomal protein L13
MKTYMAKKGELAARWYVVDVTDKVLGRVATKIATILMGKHRPEYTPHVDTGDFVIVINAAGIKLTGSSKPTQRIYERFSGYPSGRKVVPLSVMLEKHPEKVVAEAVRRMLPKNKLGRAMFKKLKVYPGSDHPHQAQQPDALEL